MNKNILAIGIIILFFLSALAPITFGSNVTNSKEQPAIEDYKFDRYLYPEYYDCYNTDEIPDYIEYQNTDVSIDDENSNLLESNLEDVTQSLVGPPMDSAWPMHCYNAQHTGRSPHSTIDTWDEIWRFKDEDYFMLIRSLKQAPHPYHRQHSR